MKKKINVSQISNGRFHHFHLARQMERFGLLEKIYTGYPRFKIRNENGIPFEKIVSYPWYQTPNMAKGRIGLGNWKWLDEELDWIGRESLDKYVSSKIKNETHLIALSGSGLKSGKEIKKRGGIFICDRGSSHIQFQNNILNEEYKIFGFKFKGIDPRIIDKELEEYDLADYISIPSDFVKESFISMGIPESKLITIPYGARKDRFSKRIESNNDTFIVLWVGNISIRKGFMYALYAFNKFQYPKKKFIVIGTMTKEIQSLLSKSNTENIIFRGAVSNDKLVEEYSRANAFVLTSIEEGLSMVQGEALACGCPVISTTNCGATNLFENNKEGFIVPIRDVGAIVEKLQLLADDKNLRTEMSNNALNRIKEIGGWDTYGENFFNFLIQN